MHSIFTRVLFKNIYLLLYTFQITAYIIDIFNTKCIVFTTVMYKYDENYTFFGLKPHRETSD